MSTKRLQRTVIEGGRTGWSKYQRRSSHRRVRAKQREALGRFRDPEWEPVIHRRPKAYKHFADKLGPAERWLVKQAGRPWDSVYADMMATFDTRTLAGRHLVFEHMLPYEHGNYESYQEGWRVHRRWRFRVDEHGILRAAHRDFSQWRRNFNPLRRQTKRWLEGRNIRVHGSKAYWLNPVEPHTLSAGAMGPRYRQGKALGMQDLERLEGLNPKERETYVVEARH